MNLHRWVVLAVGCGWSFCSWGIINGQLATGKYPEIAKVNSGTGDCVGVLIGQRVVATSAHCIRSSESVMVTFEEKPGSAVFLGMAHFQKSPLWPQKNHDLALGVLEHEVPGVDPAWITTRKVETGEAVSLAGYGCSAVDIPSDGRLRAGDTAVVAFQPYQFQTGGPGAVACYGDSGAPGFTGQDEDREVAGIVAMSNTVDATYLVSFDSTASQRFLETFVEANGVEICGFNGGCSDRK